MPPAHEGERDMKRRAWRLLGWSLVAVLIVGALCWAQASVIPVPGNDVEVTRGEIAFSGQRAHELAAELATGFTGRHSGTRANRQGALWVMGKLEAMGYETELDEFEATLYGELTPLGNVIGRKQGKRDDAIAIVAHLDQARTTVQGADNDASGIGIMLHLAEVFQNVDTQYSLLFIATDGEEYGMLGAKHFARKHPFSRYVSMAISLDNAGRYNAGGIHIAATGQRRGYTPLWLAALVQDIACGIGVWCPTFPNPATQVMERSILISFTDQGPFLAQGVPAFDLGVTSPGGWPYYHTPGDTIDRISPHTMEQVGVLVEALIREVDRSESMPRSPEPFLYFEASRTFLASQPLKAVALALIVPLYWSTCLSWNGRRIGLGAFLGQCLNLLINALPLLCGLLGLYLCAAVNIIPRFSYYPAPPKDPVLYEVKWVAVAVMLGVMVATATVLPRLKKGIPLRLEATRPVALAVLSVLSTAVYLWNPFALLFLLPALYLWPLMGPWRSLPGILANLALFVCGGLVLFLGLLMYSYELYLGWYMLWYFLQMLAFGTIPLHAALAGITAIASGLTILDSVRTTGGRVTPERKWSLPG